MSMLKILILRICSLPVEQGWQTLAVGLTCPIACFYTAHKEFYFLFLSGWKKLKEKNIFELSKFHMIQISMSL